MKLKVLELENTDIFFDSIRTLKGIISVPKMMHRKFNKVNFLSQQALKLGE